MIYNETLKLYELSEYDDGMGGSNQFDMHVGDFPCKAVPLAQELVTAIGGDISQEYYRVFYKNGNLYGYDKIPVGRFLELSSVEGKLKVIKSSFHPREKSVLAVLI